MHIHLFAKTFFYQFVLSAGITGLFSATAAADDTTQPWTPPHSHTIGSALGSLSDTAITAKVKSKLNDEESLKKSSINVSTSDGVVTLYGSVSDSKAKALAESAIKSIEGVKSVHNVLEISPTGENTVRPTGPKGPQEPADNRAR